MRVDFRGICRVVGGATKHPPEATWTRGDSRLGRIWSCSFVDWAVISTCWVTFKKYSVIGIWWVREWCSHPCRLDIGPFKVGFTRAKNVGVREGVVSRNTEGLSHFSRSPPPNWPLKISSKCHGWSEGERGEGQRWTKESGVRFQSVSKHGTLSP